MANTRTFLKPKQELKRRVFSKTTIKNAFQKDMLLVMINLRKELKCKFKKDS